MAIQAENTLSKVKKLPPTDCVACRGPVSFLGTNCGYTYGTCSRCKTVQLMPIPSQVDLNKAYSDSEFASHAHGQGDPDEVHKSSVTYYESIADVLTGHGVSGLVIDYGAGWGGLCKVLINRGFNCKGLELAKNMVDECQRRKLPVEQRSLESLVAEGYTAQALTLCGVFEHFADPRAFLKNAFALLEDEGVLVSLQPTAPFALLLASVSAIGNSKKNLPSAFWIFHAPWHVALYSLEGMKALGDELGFDLIETRFTPQGRVGGLYGIAQRLLELANTIGWKCFRSKWPLLTSHTFVFRKRSA
jgi:hypothetical protein